MDTVEFDGAGPERALLVGSSGGHLSQLLSLRPWWVARKREWVTFDTADALDLLSEEKVTWAHHPTTRNIPNLLRNGRLAVTVVRRVRPDIVVSTGAAVALPFFVVARVLGIPTVFIEVFDRIESPTLTGRLCRPFTTRVMVQTENQRALYPGSEVVGRLL